MQEIDLEIYPKIPAYLACPECPRHSWYPEIYPVTLHTSSGTCTNSINHELILDCPHCHKALTKKPLNYFHCLNCGKYFKRAQLIQSG